MQIKLPKGAIGKGAAIGGIAAILVLAISGILRATLPSSAGENANNPLDHVHVAQLVQSPTVNGDCNVVGNSNSIQGGINCPKFGPNPPAFEIGDQNVKPRPDGTFDLVISTNLKSQTLVKLVYVSVEGPDVLDFDFRPAMTGMFASWYGKMDDDGAKALGWTNPQPGPYIITIHTSKSPSAASKINLRYNVVPN
jgi:hypothetical protein